MDAMANLSRRRVMRGMLGGTAVTVALPFLECFLNGHGDALASGAPLPTRFASWFWGLGFNRGRWEPQHAGALASQSLGPEMAPLEPLKDKINIYSKLRIYLDGKANFAHKTGWWGQHTGATPRDEAQRLPTFDTFIADAIGSTTRFRSINAACDGDARNSRSTLAGGIPQPSETSPAQLYARIFGPEFKDPNSAEFTPDPRVLAHRSVLSAIRDEKSRMFKDIGAADRARIDEYFTSLRQLEHQLDLQLTKPAPVEACRTPAGSEEYELGSEVEVTVRTHTLMCELLAHAFACDQTRVINLAFSAPGSALRLPGEALTHHMYSHMEPIDPALGYKKKMNYFNVVSAEALATFIRTLDKIQEGDRTLLDRTLAIATTDCGDANTHSPDNIPVITAGRGNGIFKTGLHLVNDSDAATRVPLTIMQALKLPIAKFGAESNETSRPITEVLA